MAVRDGLLAPYKQLVNGLQAVPTVATQIPLVGGTSPTQWIEIEQLVFSGTAAGTLTITATGGSLVFVVALNTATVFNFPAKLKLLGTSITWAGTATVTAAIVGSWL